MLNTVLFLIIITLCSHANSRTKGLDSIMTKFIALHQASGKDFEQISRLVAQVSDGIKDDLMNQENIYHNFQANCDKGSILVNDFTTKLVGDIQGIDAAVSNAEKEIIKEQKQETNFQGQIEDLKLNIESAKNQIKKETENYKTFGIEAEYKLTTIRNIKNILNDELKSAETMSSNKASFVQLRTKEFDTELESLKKILTDMTLKESLYSPMASTLLQIAESKNFADQTIIAKILKVLADMENNLIAFRKNQETEGKKILKDLMNGYKALEDQMNLLNKMVASSKSEVINYQSLIKNSLEDKISIEEIVKRKNFELTYWTKLCDYQNKLKLEGKDWSDHFSKSLKEITDKLSDLY